MTSGSPLLDLLVVGGLTVDRFADGSSSPGGTVMHVARAAAPRGVEIGIVTASGDEPEARAGLAELRGIARLVEHRHQDGSTTFRHRDTQHGRRLWFEGRGGSVELDPGASTRIPTPAILFAPVADEIAASALTVWDDTWRRGAILQGWLRSMEEGAEVRPVPLRAVSGDVVDALSQFDVLVASREDLVAESDAPHDQLTALRGVFGPRPALVVTDCGEGLWLDTASTRSNRSSRRHLAVPWRVEAVSTVGSGDILAAFMTMRSDDPSTSIDLCAQDAMRVVAEVLEERKLRGIEDERPG